MADILVTGDRLAALASLVDRLDEAVNDDERIVIGRPFDVRTEVDGVGIVLSFDPVLRRFGVGFTEVEEGE